MRRMVLIGVLALAACAPSPDDVPIAGSGDDVLSDSEASLAGPTLDLVRAMRSEDRSVRLRAAEALGKLGDAAAAPALVRELADKDLYARKAAEEALGCVLEQAPRDTAVRNAAHKALSALLRDSDMSVRYWAADAFSRLRERRAVPLLIKVLSSDSDESVRGHAAFALGEIADPAAFEALKGALKDDGNSWNVSYAIAALAKNGDERAARLLLDALVRKQYAMISGAGEFFVTQSGAEIDQRLIEMLQQTHEVTLRILLAHHPNPAVAAAAQANGTEGAEYGRTGC
jgi:HEAT repeat protein